MTRHLLLAIGLMYSLSLLSQHNMNRDVLVSVNRSVRGGEVNLIYNANNKTSGKQTIVLNIEGRSYERADGSIPVVRELNPGTNRLLQLTNISAVPGYGYMYVPGCVDTEPDDVTYLLPLAPGKTTRIDSLTTIGEAFLGEEKTVKMIAFSLPAEKGDAVHAARRGLVIEVEDGNPAPKGEGLAFRSKNNYVVIEHEDCTRGRYEMFAEKGITAEVGNEVEAGEPLGRVMDGSAMMGGSQLRFSVYYPDLTRKALIAKQKDRALTHERKYVAPVFSGVAGPGEVTVAHPQEVIFQEMRKKDIKRWKKTKSKN